MNKNNELFFGLIKLNRTLYNILYTLLCVCILLCTICSLVFTTLVAIKKEILPDFENMYMFLCWCVVIFLAEKIIDKKYYA